MLASSAPYSRDPGMIARALDRQHPELNHELQIAVAALQGIETPDP